MRSAGFASVASILLASMLLGSVLISNVYAKGSGSEKSKYNLEESCNDTVKGKQITITGDRNLETIDTNTDQKSKNNIDTDKTVDKNGLQGQKGVIVNNPAFGDLTKSPDIPIFNELQFGTKKSNQHFEQPDIFIPQDAIVVNSSGTFVDSSKAQALNDLIKSKLNQDENQRIKDSIKYKKTFPLKERRVFNVCGLPIGNAVDGFQFNKIDGTKKSDILLGTSAADDINGKAGGDVIQARDDDDIVHAGSGDDSVQGGFGNDNIHADDGDDAVFAGPNDDYVNGGSGNDELYGQDGDDTLEGGPGADFFDCGPGFDVVVDFNPSEGDVTNDNCEDVRTTL